MTRKWTRNWDRRLLKKKSAPFVRFTHPVWHMWRTGDILPALQCVRFMKQGLCVIQPTTRCFHYIYAHYKNVFFVTETFGISERSHAQRPSWTWTYTAGLRAPWCSPRRAGGGGGGERGLGFSAEAEPAPDKQKRMDGWTFDMFSMFYCNVTCFYILQPIQTFRNWF